MKIDDKEMAWYLFLMFVLFPVSIVLGFFVALVEFFIQFATDVKIVYSQLLEEFNSL